MQIDPLDQRIRDLCEGLSTAENDEEIRELIGELQAALHDHAEFMRLMTFKTVKRFPKNDSDSKAAD